MGTFHNQAYQIERLTKKLSYKNRSRFIADEIDCFPIVAIQFCLIQIESYSHSNYRHKLERLSKVSDEVYCVIGNKQLSESFNFENVNEESIIQGTNNKEYLKNLINFLTIESNILSVH